MIKRLLALLLCLCLLPVGAVAAVRAPAYTVSNGLTYVPDPDVLALFHMNNSCLNTVSNSIPPGMSYPLGDFDYCSGFDYCLKFGRKLNSYSYLSFSDSSLDLSKFSSFCFDFRLKCSDLSDSSNFVFRLSGGNSTTETNFDIFHLGASSNCRFLNSTSIISSSVLYSSLVTGSFVSVRVIYDDGIVYLFADGNLLGSGQYAGLNANHFCFVADCVSYLDEIRITTGSYCVDLDSYTPATAPFIIPEALAFPDTPVAECIYLQSALLPGALSLGGDLPESPAAGDTYVSLNEENVAQSVQLYDGTAWQDVEARIYSNSGWHDVIGYQFDLGAPDTPIDPDSPHDFLSTPFTAYTVTEGLLLALLLCVVAAAILKLIKEGFYWLW